jgi:hypothetical protein
MTRIQEAITAQVKQVLTQLVSQVAPRVPSTRGSVSENLVRGIPTVCASFLTSPEADTVDLCVEIEAVAGGVSVSADVVRGGTGEILSEMTQVTIFEGQNTEVAVRTLEEYVRDQSDVIVRALP